MRGHCGHSKNLKAFFNGSRQAVSTYTEVQHKAEDSEDKQEVRPRTCRCQELLQTYMIDTWYYRRDAKLLSIKQERNKRTGSYKT